MTECCLTHVVENVGWVVPDGAVGGRRDAAAVGRRQVQVVVSLPPLGRSPVLEGSSTTARKLRRKKTRCALRKKQPSLLNKLRT